MTARALRKAAQAVDMAIGDLLEANKQATALEHLLIIDALDDARRLQARLASILHAIESKD
jgi:hypothetical protein